MSRVDILRDGEDPIVVNGFGDRIQIPVCTWPGEIPEVEIDEEWTFSCEPKVNLCLSSGIYTNDYLRTVSATYIKNYIIPKYLNENFEENKDNVYIIYEIWAEPDNKTLNFEVEVLQGEVEFIIDDSTPYPRIDISEKTKKLGDYITKLINYE